MTAANRPLRISAGQNGQMALHHQDGVRVGPDDGEAHLPEGDLVDERDAAETADEQGVDRKQRQHRQRVLVRGQARHGEDEHDDG